MKQLTGHLAGYKPVKQRIHEFRQDHPDWTIQTVIEAPEGHWLAVTRISNEHGHLVATGHAYERAQKPFDLEKAETSSVGRALVFAGWTDSLELSQEEKERAAQVPQRGPRVDKGPAKVGDAKKPGRIKPPPANLSEAVEDAGAPVTRIKMPPAPEYQIDGDTEPPSEPTGPLAANTRTVSTLCSELPVQSAPKTKWREYVAELVAATAEEGQDIDWKLLSAGKGFNDLTIDELKQLAQRSTDILRG